jgi:hypothetical protein
LFRPYFLIVFKPFVLTLRRMYFFPSSHHILRFCRFKCCTVFVRMCENDTRRACLLGRLPRRSHTLPFMTSVDRPARVLCCDREKCFLSTQSPQTWMHYLRCGRHEGVAGEKGKRNHSQKHENGPREHG